MHRHFSCGTRAENSVKLTKPPKGKVHEIFGPINEKVDDELLNSLIKVNVDETTKVTQAVLLGTLKRKKGYCEYWFWCYECIPSDPLYDATKAYIDQFSRWLNVADPIHWWWLQHLTGLTPQHAGENRT
ncbi:putative very-long-chain 3-oxoacyl-CoA reductase [Helianthus annuus]|nr:putative very-long-chain 3-oxoacyl-CoA reductase [Helianthus annuus]